MIPLKDLNRCRSTPWMTYLLFALNLGAFAWQLSVLAAGGEQAYVGFMMRLGLVPENLTSPATWSTLAVPPPATIFSSMFLHGDLLHLAGNMLYLWVFADNVEDAMGPIRFLLFYLLCGMAAAAAQVALMPDSTVPMVGASGAIAGVLGAYLILYPGAQVLTLVFLFIFVRMMYLPAVLMLGIWFLVQVLSAGGATEAGVAWYAHIGGFAAGVLTIYLFAGRRRGRGGGVDSYRR